MAALARGMAALARAAQRGGRFAAPVSKRVGRFASPGAAGELPQCAGWLPWPARRSPAQRGARFPSPEPNSN